MTSRNKTCYNLFRIAHNLDTRKLYNQADYFDRLACFAARNPSFKRKVESQQNSDDFYSLLNLKRDASDEDLKKAHFNLAKKWHPDINKSPEASEKFNQIQKAYNTLKDPKSRELYDSGKTPSAQQYHTYSDIFNEGVSSGTKYSEPVFDESSHEEMLKSIKKQQQEEAMSLYPYECKKYGVETVAEFLADAQGSGHYDDTDVLDAEMVNQFPITPEESKRYHQEDLDKFWADNPDFDPKTGKRWENKPNFNPEIGEQSAKQLEI